MKCMFLFVVLSACGFSALPAQKITSSDCLPDAIPAEQRRVRGLGSRNFTFGVLPGFWTSHEITTRVIRILVQERLGIHVDVNFVHGLDTPTMYPWIAGCDATDWDCANFNPAQPAFDLVTEFWEYADRSTLYLEDEVSKLDPEAYSRVVKVGSVGYSGTMDIFIWKWVIDKARSETGLSLDWWLDLQKPEAFNYFTSYNQFDLSYGVYQWCSFVDDNGVEVNHTERSKLEALGYACNASEEYNNPYRKTRDGVWDQNGEHPVKYFPVFDCSESESQVPDTYDKYMSLGYKCVGDGWFISPPCVARSPGDEWKDDCMMVLSYGPDDTVAQVASLAFLPVVVGSVSNWDAYEEFIYDTAQGHVKRGNEINKVMFEWNAPDNSIGAYYSKVSVVPLQRQKILWADGWNSPPHATTTLMHENVYGFAPEIAQFVENFKLSVGEMEWMLSNLPTYVTDTVDVLSAQDIVACDWVKLYEAKWSKWVGKQSCRVNAYFDLAERLCKNCPVGKVSKRQSEGIESCIACEPGLIFQSGTGKCTPCGIGSFANHSESLTECVMCKKGSYEDSIGSSSCKVCPDYSTTTDIASRRAEDCVCAQDAYLASPGVCSLCPGGRVKQEVGSLNLSSCYCLQGSYLRTGEVICSSCPEGLTCLYGSDDHNRLPAPLPGYWVRASNPFEVYLCLNVGRCPGGGPNLCSINREPSSIGCGLCLSHSYRDESDKCQRCDGASVWPVVVAAILGGILMLSILVVVINRDVLKQQNSALTVATILGITFTCLQTLGVFNGLAVQITEPLKSLLAAMQLLSFDLKVLKTDCLLGNGPFTGFLYRQLIAPFGIVIVGLVILIKKWFNPLTVSVIVDFTNTVGTVFTVFFISIVAAAISPFIAYKHPGNSGWSVQSMPAILQFTPDWNVLLTIGACSVACVAFPFLAMVSYGCYMYPRFITRPSYSRQLRMFRFLFFRFKPEVYYYGAALVFRNLLLCLVPVLIRGEPVAQVVAMSTVLLAFLVPQMMLQPWKLPVSNKFDGALTAILQLILVVVATTIEGSATTASIEIMSYIVTVVLLGAVVVGFVYVVYCYLRPRPWYHFFICHHKVGAAAQSRYLKLLIVQKKGKSVFIDSDNLLDLDGLFDTVKARVGHLIVFLTKFTLTRPWCSGEIVTACRNRVRTTKFIGPDFEELDDNDYENLETYIDRGGAVLAKFLIGFSDIETSYRWLLSSSVPSIMRNNSLCGLRPYEAFAFEILGVKNAELHSSAFFSAHDGLLFSSDVNDFEATASVGILAHCLRLKYMAMSSGPMIILCDFEPEAMPDANILSCIAAARASIVLLSIHSLSSPQQLFVICHNMALAARREKCLVVPVTSPTWIFPTDRYYEDVLPRVESLDVDPEKRAVLVKAFFNTIAVNLSTHASQTVISTQCDQVLDRLGGKMDALPLKPQRTGEARSPRSGSNVQSPEKAGSPSRDCSKSTTRETASPCKKIEYIGGEV